MRASIWGLLEPLNNLNWRFQLLCVRFSCSRVSVQKCEVPIQDLLDLRCKKRSVWTMHGSLGGFGLLSIWVIHWGDWFWFRVKKYCPSLTSNVIRGLGEKCRTEFIAFATGTWILKTFAKKCRNHFDTSTPAKVNNFICDNISSSVQKGGLETPQKSK